MRKGLQQNFHFDRVILIHCEFKGSPAEGYLARFSMELVYNDPTRRGEL
jgi:hypothetical protein